MRAAMLVILAGGSDGVAGAGSAGQASSSFGAGGGGGGTGYIHATTAPMNNGTISPPLS